MAHPAIVGDWTSRCSYKRATLLLCTSNILVALFLLQTSLLHANYGSSSPPPAAAASSFNSLDGIVVRTKEERERIEDSNRLRRQLLPIHLIERVKEIQQETEAEISRAAALNAARQKVALELANRLRELKLTNRQESQKALEEWKKRKLEKRTSEIAASRGGEEKVAITRVEVDSPQEVDMENDMMSWGDIPSECRAEPRTDYLGVAVRWGLTHHVGSPADCCQACLDQAKNVTQGEKKCNVWVYCPQEGGCHSPDKYVHENHECWLKQADEPEINFKGHYDEEYRQQHPSAPSIVPWVSGFVS